MWTSEFWITHGWSLAAAVLANVSCGLVGCYLVLRRMSLLGDAMSHALLPGLVAGFLLSGSLTGPGVMIGAVLVALLTAFVTQWLTHTAKVPEDASLGTVFTTFFAIGVIMISRFARHVHLDADCVVFGNIHFVPFERPLIILGWPVPPSVVVLLLVAVLVITLIVLMWKEFLITSFDPRLAQSMGLPVWIIHYLLIALVAMVSVASFSIVGSILVVAMLVVPGLCGHLLADRLDYMMLWSAVISIVAGVVAYLIAVWVDTTAAGMMVVVLGAFLLLTTLLAPANGVLPGMIRRQKLALRIVTEDIIALAYRREEAYRQQEVETADIPFYEIRRLVGPITGLMSVGWLCHQRHLHWTRWNRFSLQPDARERARQLVRTHRLWESFLSEHTNLPADHLHEPASRVEHFIGPQLQEEIAQTLSHPEQDPHGRPIPGLDNASTSNDANDDV